MTKFALLAASCGLLVVLSAPAKAQETADLSYLSFGLGIFDAFQHDDTATDFRVEYRHGAPLFWKIKPWFGVEGTSDGSLWGGGGILADFEIEQFYITPSVGAGLYTDGGSDKDLGHPIEFRTQIEAGYEFTNSQRLGVSLSHISNADLDNDNPGTEVLNLYYSVPVGSLF